MPDPNYDATKDPSSPHYDHINDPDLNRTSDKVATIFFVGLAIVVLVALVIANL